MRAAGLLHDRAAALLAGTSLIYGAYAAGVYLTPIAGGVVSDRWLGRHRAIVIASLRMALGHFMMASEALFFPAMATIAMGDALFGQPRARPLSRDDDRRLVPRRLRRQPVVRRAGHRMGALLPGCDFRSDRRHDRAGGIPALGHRPPGRCPFLTQRPAD